MIAYLDSDIVLRIDFIYTIANLLTKDPYILFVVKLKRREQKKIFVLIL